MTPLNVPAFTKKIQIIALIIAGIIVAVVVYTSISREEIPQEKKQILESERLEAQRKEEVSPAVKMGSATTKVVEQSGRHFKTGRIWWYICSVKMSGTATLPIRKAELKVETCEVPRNETNPINCKSWGGPMDIDISITCPNWGEFHEPGIGAVNWCIRDSEDQPATSEWSITLREIFMEEDGFAQTWFARVLSYSDETLQADEKLTAWDSVTVTCRP